MPAVRSSVISAVHYSDATKTSFVRFNSARVDAYLDVPRTAFDEMLAAASAGHYFNQRIRPHYRAIVLRSALR